MNQTSPPPWKYRDISPAKKQRFRAREAVLVRPRVMILPTEAEEHPMQMEVDCPTEVQIRVLLDHCYRHGWQPRDLQIECGPELHRFLMAFEWRRGGGDPKGPLQISERWQFRGTVMGVPLLEMSLAQSRLETPWRVEYGLPFLGLAVRRREKEVEAWCNRLENRTAFRLW